LISHLFIGVEKSIFIPQSGQLKKQKKTKENIGKPYIIENQQGKK